LERMVYGDILVDWVYWDILRGLAYRYLRGKKASRAPLYHIPAIMTSARVVI